MSDIKKLAFSGVMCATASVLMLSANLFSGGLYLLAAGAGTVIYILYFTVGKKYALTAFAVVSVISFLFCIDREAFLSFVLLLGYYPLVKTAVDKLRYRLMRLLIKLSLFNAVLASGYLILTFVFSLPSDMTLFGVSLPALIAVMYNAAFIIYDIALGLFYDKYGERVLNLVTKLLKK